MGNPGKWCIGQIDADGGTAETQYAEAYAATQYSTDPTEASTGDWKDGTVSDWNEDRGFGFMSMDDGKRAYIHRNNFGGTGSLMVGMRMRVSVKADPRNP